MLGMLHDSGARPGKSQEFHMKSELISRLPELQDADIVELIDILSSELKKRNPKSPLSDAVDLKNNIKTIVEALMNSNGIKT